MTSSDTTEGTVSVSTADLLRLELECGADGDDHGVFDNLSDGDQSYAILLSDNTTSDTRYKYVDPPDVTLKNLDLTDKGSFMSLQFLTTRMNPR